MKPVVSILTFLFLLVTASGERPLISKGADGWQYRDDGKEPGHEWRTRVVDGDPWRVGAAPLGYETDESVSFATTLSFGEDASAKHAVTYFRKAFEIERPSAVETLVAEVLVDDGAVVYLNGEEMGRVRMPEGRVSGETLAAEKLRGEVTEGVKVTLDPEHLRGGTNVLAVSVHQSDRTSSDLAFDLALTAHLRQPPLQIAYFECDATPPIGTPLAYDEMTWEDLPLSCRGVALLGEGLPVVLCVLDWIGVANEGQDAWKEALAEAADTTTDRVVVHTLHQHDAPVCDFTAHKILAAHGLGGELFDPVFMRRTIANAATALQASLRDPQPITHLGHGKGEVEEVASNRRLLGPDGKVAHTRYTACKDPEVRALPIGTVDPMLRAIGFYTEDALQLVLTFYATHPQSYYRTGGANPDFPGIARQLRETAMGGVPHIHFNGAGGDIGAGKWNDGDPSNRLKLAERLAAGMAAAVSSMEKTPIGRADLQWQVESMHLPISTAFASTEELETQLKDPEVTLLAKKGAAAYLAWHWRGEVGHAQQLSGLQLGSVRALFGPGEMVVGYQLFAQEVAGDAFVAFASYGDYGPGYICLTAQYEEGGYESSPRASRVAPEVEPIVKKAIQALLH